MHDHKQEKQCVHETKKANEADAAFAFGSKRE